MYHSGSQTKILIGFRVKKVKQKTIQKMGQYLKPVLIGVVAFVIGMIVWNLAQGTGLFNFEGSSNFEGKRVWTVDDNGDMRKVA